MTLPDSNGCTDRPSPMACGSTGCASPSRGRHRPSSEWLSLPQFQAYQPQIMAMIDDQRWALLLDSFTKSFLLERWTSRKGRHWSQPVQSMDIGNERQGHAAWLRQEFGEGKSKSSSPMTFDAFEIPEDNYPDSPTPFWASAVESSRKWPQRFMPPQKSPS